VLPSERARSRPVPACHRQWRARRRRSPAVEVGGTVGAGRRTPIVQAPRDRSRNHAKSSAPCSAACPARASARARLRGRRNTSVAPGSFTAGARLARSRSRRGPVGAAIWWINSGTSVAAASQMSVERTHAPRGHPTFGMTLAADPAATLPHTSDNPPRGRPVSTGASAYAPPRRQAPPPDRPSTAGEQCARRARQVDRDRVGGAGDRPVRTATEPASTRGRSAVRTLAPLRRVRQPRSPSVRHREDLLGWLEHQPHPPGSWWSCARRASARPAPSTTAVWTS